MEEAHLSADYQIRTAESRVRDDIRESATNLISSQGTEPRAQNITPNHTEGSETAPPKALSTDTVAAEADFTSAEVTNLARAGLLGGDAVQDGAGRAIGGIQGRKLPQTGSRRGGGVRAGGAPLGAHRQGVQRAPTVG